MKIIETKIEDLIPADYNPRELTNKQHQHLKESLTKFGFVDPVIANMAKERKNIIIGGHQRVRVWKEMGHDTAPTNFVELPDIEDEKELNIRLNKNTGQDDIEKLANYFDEKDLLKWGYEKHEFGMFEPYNDEDINLPTGENKFQKMTFTLTEEQASKIKAEIEAYKKTDTYKYIETYGNENSNANALYGIMHEYSKTN